jgi:hypothetical protein
VVRLGGAFWRFWWTGAHFAEGRRWLEELLQPECAVEPGVRARLLEGAGWMANVLGDLPCAEQRFEQALSLRRAVGEPRSIATTLGWLSFEVAAGGDLERAISLTEEAAAVARQHGDAHACPGAHAPGHPPRHGRRCRARRAAPGAGR